MAQVFFKIACPDIGQKSAQEETNRALYRDQRKFAFVRPPPAWVYSRPGRTIMTIGLALKIALAFVCFGIGAACLIGTICMLGFISATGAAIPATLGAFGAIFLWFTYLLLRRVRWHND